jgi:hypothetical protein
VQADDSDGVSKKLRVVLLVEIRAGDGIDLSLSKGRSEYRSEADCSRASFQGCVPVLGLVKR